MADYRGGGGGGASVVPATFVVASDREDYPLTQAGLVAAIAALPAQGGEIWIGPGTLVIASAIVLPNKPITIRGSGTATFISFSGAAELFDINFGNDFRFYDFSVAGDGSVGQVLWKFGAAAAGVNRLNTLTAKNIGAGAIHTIIKGTAGGTPVGDLEDCLFTMPDSRLCYFIDSTVGTFYCRGVRSLGLDSTTGYDSNGGIKGHPTVRAVNCSFGVRNGFILDYISSFVGCLFEGGGSANVLDLASITLGGGGFTGDLSEFNGCYFGNLTLTGAAAANVHITDAEWSNAVVPARCVDLVVGGGWQIKNCTFPTVSYSSEAIRIATDSNIVQGCTAAKILETGAANSNRYDDLGEDSTVIGAASVIASEKEFAARLQRDSATQLSLQRYAGKDVFIRGARVAVPAAGLTLSNVANLIAADGTDSGGAPAVNTLYYLYVSNSKASFAASGIRISATAPTINRGAYYLGTSGNALNWRFVGWVRTISNAGTVNFADSVTQRLVVNYYNRLRKRMFSCPAYSDGNNFTTYTYAAATFGRINGGTGDFLEYISNGEDSVKVSAHGRIAADATVAFSVGIGDNSQTQPNVTAAVPASLVASFGVNDTIQPAVGYRTLDLLGANEGAPAVSATIVSDTPRFGAAADPATTYIEAEIMS